MTKKEQNAVEIIKNLIEKEISVYGKYNIEIDSANEIEDHVWIGLYLEICGRKQYIEFDIHDTPENTNNKHGKIVVYTEEADRLGQEINFDDYTVKYFWMAFLDWPF